MGTRYSQILHTQAVDRNYEYLCTDGSLVHMSFTGDSSADPTISRCNYDGSNFMSVGIYDAVAGGMVSSVRGLLPTPEGVYITSRNFESEQTRVIYVNSADWVDSSTPTSYTGYYCPDAGTGGHGLSYDQTKQYIYLTSEGTNFMSIIDLNTSEVTSVDVMSHCNGIACSGNTLYLCSPTSSSLIVLTMDTPTTVGNYYTVSMDIEPWQIAVDPCFGLFYISEIFGPIHQYGAVMDGDAITGFNSITLALDDEILGFCTYTKVYPDVGIYFDIFAARNVTGELDLIFNNPASAAGGDPQIRTLDGTLYTVPDYLTEFNYLTLVEPNGRLLIDCKTRELTASDFPNGMWDYGEGKRYCLGEFNAALCSHTYLDTLRVTWEPNGVGEVNGLGGLNSLTINMDTLEVSDERFDAASPIINLKRPAMSQGLCRTATGQCYDILDSTQYLELDIQLPAGGRSKLRLWSDTTLLERHSMILTLDPVGCTNMYGAVVNRPCHRFEGAESAQSVQSVQSAQVNGRAGDELTLVIEGHHIPYRCADDLPIELVNYLQTHSLRICQ